MDKKFDIDTDGNFKKFLRNPHQNEAVEERTPTLFSQGVTQEAVVEKKTKSVQPSQRSKVPSRGRAKGRPKVKRELKKRYTFTILPSVYEQAFKKAEQEGLSLSEVVSSLLENYIQEA